MIRSDASIQLLAKCVEEGVFQSLMNAANNPDRAAYWFKHADHLEAKFKTEYGKHYTAYTQPDLKITYT